MASIYNQYTLLIEISFLIILTTFNWYRPFCSNNINTLFHLSFWHESTNTMLCCENKQSINSNLAYSRSHHAYKLRLIMLWSCSNDIFQLICRESENVSRYMNENIVRKYWSLYSLIWDFLLSQINIWTHNNIV